MMENKILIGLATVSFVCSGAYFLAGHDLESLIFFGFSLCLAGASLADYRPACCIRSTGLKGG